MDLQRFLDVTDRVFILIWRLILIAVSCVAGYFGWQIGGALELGTLNQIAISVAAIVLTPLLLWIVFTVLRILNFGDS